MITLSKFKNNYNKITDSIRERCLRNGRNFDELKIIVVTKSIPDEFFIELVNSGYTIVGENRPQQIRDRKKLIDGKFSAAALQPEWHMIGTLQTNKIKYLLPFIKLIHSVNSLKLLLEINRQSEKLGIVTECLLEINTAEETKTGAAENDIFNMMKFSFENRDTLKNISIRGLMTIAPNTANEKIINSSFSALAELKNKMNTEFNESLNYLSMGMSNDYLLAVDNGATHLRIGSAFFE